MSPHSRPCLLFQLLKSDKKPTWGDRPGGSTLAKDHSKSLAFLTKFPFSCESSGPFCKEGSGEECVKADSAGLLSSPSLCRFPTDLSAPSPLLSPAVLLIPSAWPCFRRCLPGVVAAPWPRPRSCSISHWLAQPLGRTMAISSSRLCAWEVRGQHSAQKEATWQDYLLPAATHRLLLGTH